MKTLPRVLVAGSTGYLGGYIVKQLLAQRAEFKALARNNTKLLALGLEESQIIQAQVTHPDELADIFEGIDVVISCLGITRQRDGLGYVDVDYQANLNLLKEAERSGVSKFIYISAYKAQTYPQVRLLNAKERFARRLLQSTRLTPCVIRPNGFFSDISEVFNMAQSGRVFTFGRGDNLLNPIHGSDLARFCIDAIERKETELAVGGPDVLSVNDIVSLAFEAQGKAIRNTHIPDVWRLLALGVARRLPERWAGPAEFFLTMLGQDSVAPVYGEQRLSDYFAQLNQSLTQR